MRFDIVTIFPEAFASYFSASMMRRAIRSRKARIVLHDLRDATTDAHRTVDDRPYGGGVGMVLKAEPIVKTLERIPRLKRSKTFLLSAKGKSFVQADARRFAKLNQLILVCGHYEGVDERVLRFLDGELSVGDYVLTGGELPAMVIVDAVVRLLPGTLGKDESSRDESHAAPGVLEYPQYTRPPVFRRFRVPRVLLSGNHAAIRAWREGKRRAR